MSTVLPLDFTYKMGLINKCSLRYQGAHLYLYRVILLPYPVVLAPFY